MYRINRLVLWSNIRNSKTAYLPEQWYRISNKTLKRSIKVTLAYLIGNWHFFMINVDEGCREKLHF
ncbi:hypothetical protein GV64_04135 [Endozoicomonas elysicola]|uniref:Uncharacterized protein n=1 Tax=Endozoicomonas elysicola TaxID=305900 RepID=A0A081K7B6_9GAMM|nr:hypothetical protein GV64_04135 [Endozoicomonas elysicola]